MATFKVSDGIDNYIRQLQNCADKTENIIKRSAWEGARVVMDAVKAEAQTIPTHGSTKGSTDVIDGLTPTQKAGVIASLGIARFRQDGNFLNVKIGSDGYNTVYTKKYPKGQPNAMLIRSLESGTSFRNPYPFVSRAVSKTRGKSIEAMRKQCDEEIKKIMQT
jgi:HK97 gp10 family phage protein